LQNSSKRQSGFRYSLRSADTTHVRITH
jgi:hypothetical protein